MSARDIDRRWTALREAVPDGVRADIDALRDLVENQSPFEGLIAMLQAQAAEETRHRHEMEKIAATQSHDLRIKLIFALFGGVGLGGTISEAFRSWMP